MLKFLIQKLDHGRHKRSTPRLRKEYRRLSEEERARFHTALRALKADTVSI